MVRLLKPLDYYREKYGDALWGLNKLYLLMEKQHNRGQEGAGMAAVKLDVAPGEEYIFRERAEGTGAIQDIFAAVHHAIKDFKRVKPEAGVEELPFVGDMYMGHLRYSTTGRSGVSYLHPFLRRNNWRSRNLSLAGNFNLTNVDEIMDFIVSSGQHPRHNADTFIILEQLGYLLDEEVERLYRRFKEQGLKGQEMNDAIEENIQIEEAGKTIAMGAGCTLDLGAVGKGSACDVAREYLKEQDGVQGAVIAVGGSILTYGRKPDGTAFRVAVQNPDEENGSYMGVIDLTGTACVSTSGDYEKYFVQDGKRYHHILDPATGYPSESGLSSVTVVCPDAGEWKEYAGLLSDGLCTACFVLGKEKGMELLEQYGMEGVFIDKERQVTVTDDGTGFDLETVRSGGSIGLENVRRRMARFPGSRMQITSAPGSGTRITLIYGKQGKNEGDPG